MKSMIHLITENIKQIFLGITIVGSLSWIVTLTAGNTNAEIKRIHEKLDEIKITQDGNTLRVTELQEVVQDLTVVASSLGQTNYKAYAKAVEEAVTSGFFSLSSSKGNSVVVEESAPAPCTGLSEEKFNICRQKFIKYSKRKK